MCKSNLDSFDGGFLGSWETDRRPRELDMSNQSDSPLVRRYPRSISGPIRQCIVDIGADVSAAGGIPAPPGAETT
ncbi:hypothetical protein GCM10009533_34790 [Saccharopolyspora spinosporotrichia]|uniref:Uncharacterized protein n=1 Tax=Saccharopolyspora erythraea TaxID=1836 RepID=A0ABP3N171_SACER